MIDQSFSFMRQKSLFYDLTDQGQEFWQWWSFYSPLQK
jgi:hypothetical protein